MIRVKLKEVTGETSADRFKRRRNRVPLLCSRDSGSQPGNGEFWEDRLLPVPILGLQFGCYFSYVVGSLISFYPFVARGPSECE